MNITKFISTMHNLGVMKQNTKIKKKCNAIEHQRTPCHGIDLYLWSEVLTEAIYIYLNGFRQNVTSTYTVHGHKVY